ncbi:MAG: chloroperoxidase [Verrucomicrobia bacterium]|nr:MAG: chloroperoxidase [Verrucomicrobiota bacterium]
MKFSLLLLFVISSTAFARGPAGSFRQAYGPLFHPQPPDFADNTKKFARDPVHHWNQIAIDATGLDHTPVAQGEHRTFGEQLGPGRASRAMAIVHIAIFDAINAVLGQYRSYTGIQSAAHPFSTAAAVGQAAHDTLVSLFPSQKASFDQALADDLLRITGGPLKQNGVTFGKQVAAAILAMRVADGAEIPELHLGVDYSTSNLPGHWRQDPISLIPIALGSHWGGCKPFVVKSTSQFEPPPPPALTSAAYTAAYNEAKNFGGDGINTPTQRTSEQTFIGTFWAYDGTPSLCAPPRLYNQITVQIADQTKLRPLELARLLALVNVAMADTGMSVWESKYHYDFWRPVTAIRESDPGTGPTGAGDGNATTIGDPTFTPLGAPASNLVGPNFTPPFPAYPSGHAGFGGAIFETIRRFYGTDHIGFTFVSDEFNGVTRDHNGNVRPYMPRSFLTLSQAEEENGQSRIYLGIHWRFDKVAGIRQGEKVADYVFNHAFLPVESQ